MQFVANKEENDKDRVRCHVMSRPLAAFKDDMSLRFPDEQIDFAFLILDSWSCVDGL